MSQVKAELIKELRERTGVGMGKCKEALQESGGDIELAISNLRKSGIASAVKKEGRETNEGAIATSETGDTLALIEVNAETDFVVRNEKFQHFIKEMADEVVATKPKDLESFLQQNFSKDPSLTIDQFRSTVVQAIGENIQIKKIKTIDKNSSSSYGIYSHMGGQIVCVVEISGSNNEKELAREVAMHVAAAHPEFLAPEDVPEDVLNHEREIIREQIKNKPEEIIGKIIDGKLRAFYEQSCLRNQKFIKDDSMTVENFVKKKGSGLALSSFLRWKVG